MKPRPEPIENRAGAKPLLLAADYAAWMGYFLYLYFVGSKTRGESEATIFARDLIFVQFVGYWILVGVARAPSGSRIGHPVARVLLLAASVGIGGAIIHEVLGSWVVVLLWTVNSIAAFYRDPRFEERMLLHTAWIIVSGFLVALVASMAGIGQHGDSFEHLGVVVSWGLLYYAGSLAWVLVGLRRPGSPHGAACARTSPHAARGT